MKFDMNYLLILMNIILLVSGQLLWKIGLTKYGKISFDNLFVLFISPHIILGLMLYVIATLIWFYLLSRMPLSVLYPLQSLAYVLGIILAVILLKR